MIHEFKSQNSNKLWSQLQIRHFFQLKNIGTFLISPQNICCGYSLEAPQRGTSNEYPNVFVKKIGKIFCGYPVLAEAIYRICNVYLFLENGYPQNRNFIYINVYAIRKYNNINE